MARTASPRRSALLVLPAGPERRSAARVLRRQGLEPKGVSDAYRATALFATAPAAVVVVALGSLGKGGASFVRTLRARSRRAIVVGVVPADRRRLAVRALEAGADAYLLEPWTPEELDAVLLRLRARTPAAVSPSVREALPHLADEVAHAVNNPLQILALHAEAGGLPDATTLALKAEVRRIRDVVDWLERFARTDRFRPVPTRLGPLLDRALEAARAGGRIDVAPRAPGEGPIVLADPDLAASALASLLLLVAARADGDRARVAGRVVEARHGRGAEAALRAEALRIPTEELRGLRSAIFVTDDRTRRTYPGLALPEAVARRHGGRLVARPTRDGTLLAIRFPVPGEDGSVVGRPRTLRG